MSSLLGDILGGISFVDSLGRNGTVSRQGSQLSYKPTWYENIFGVNSDKQLAIEQQNIANEQFDKQFALQQETHNANLKNMSFNQNLALRQQNMAEESYKNGIINQASQWQKLGVNPAALSGSVSGQSMSGGSSVSGVGGSSASGRNGSSFNQQSLAAILPSLLSYRSFVEENKLAKKQLEVENKKVDVENKKVDSDIALNESTIGERDRRFGLDSSVASSEIAYKDASTSFIQSQSAYQDLLNDDFKKFFSLYPKGSYTMLKLFQGLDWKVATAIGVVGLISGSANLYDSVASKSSSYPNAMSLFNKLRSGKSSSSSSSSSSSGSYSRLVKKSSKSSSSVSKTSSPALVSSSSYGSNSAGSKKTSSSDSSFKKGSTPLYAYKSKKSVPELSIVEELVGSENLLEDEEYEAYKELNFEALNVVHNVKKYESLPKSVQQDIKEVVEEHSGVDFTIDSDKLDKIEDVIDYTSGKSSKIQKAYIEDILIRETRDYTVDENGFMHRKGYAGSTKANKMVDF